MMKTLLLLLIAVAGTACVNPQGHLQVNRKLTLKRKTIFRRTKTKNIKRGTYGAKIVFSSSKKAFLKIDGVKKQFPFHLPKTHLSMNGVDTLFVPAAELGQGYDLDLTVQSHTSEGPEMRESSDCSVAVERFECPNGPSSCHTEMVTVEGKKRVIYKMVTTTRAFTAHLMLPGSNVDAAVFEGSDSDAHKNILHESVCHPLANRKGKKIPGIPGGDDLPGFPGGKF